MIFYEQRQNNNNNNLFTSSTEYKGISIASFAGTMLSAIRAVTYHVKGHPSVSIGRFQNLSPVSLSLSTLPSSNDVLTSRFFSSSSPVEREGDGNDGHTDPRDPESMSFAHFGKRTRFRGYKKFKSPRKRASKLFGQLNQEACEKAKQSNPSIWQENIQVGDAVELKMVVQGGLKESEKQETEKVRGMVLGIVKRGLGSSILLRDFVFGVPIERRIPMYSPMVLDAKILEKNFLHKGKKKVRRSKLYYLRDRNPLLTKVSKY